MRNKLLICKGKLPHLNPLQRRGLKPRAFKSPLLWRGLGEAQKSRPQLLETAFL